MYDEVQRPHFFSKLIENIGKNPILAWRRCTQPNWSVQLTPFPPLASLALKKPRFNLRWTWVCCAVILRKSSLSREHWMIYRGQGFPLRSYDLAPCPPPSPLSRQQPVSLSQSSCVSLVELTEGKGGELGVGEQPIRTTAPSINHSILSAGLPMSSKYLLQYGSDYLWKSF